MAGNKDSNAAVDGGLRLAELEARGLVSPASTPAYRKLIDGIYAPMLAKLGFDPAANAFADDDPDRQKLRASVVGLVAGAGHDRAVRARLIAAADKFLDGDEKALDSQYLVLALSIAVEERGLPFAKTLAEKGLSSNNAGKRQTAFRAISGSGNAEVARWFFNDFKDPRLVPFERMMSATSFLDDAATQDAAFDYLTANFDTFASGRFAGGIFASRAPEMFKDLCEVPQADRVDAKLRPVLVKYGSTLALDRALETIRNCARFRAAKAGEVSASIVAVR